MLKKKPSKQNTRKLVNISDLTPARKEEMYGLFEKYYDDVSYPRFIKDLEEKTHVFIFEEKQTNRLIGFSTIYRKSIPDIAPGTFLFSGDTVIHEDFWGNKMLQKSFFWFIISSKIQSPFKPVYWMLMSKGVKTYLMMRKNFKQSFPNYQRKTPNHFQEALDQFYLMKFKDSYVSNRGLILFSEKMGSVKANLTKEQETSIRDLDSQFFFSKNPNYQAGDELACIAEIRFMDFLLHIFKYFIPIFPTK